MREFLLIAVCLCLFSCENEATVAAKPDQLIPQDTMIMVLKRISLIEAHMMNSTLPLVSVHSLLKKSCEKVLTDFHLRPDRFERSMDYYASHQEEMTTIYTAILDSLTMESSKYKNIPVTPSPSGSVPPTPTNIGPPPVDQTDQGVKAESKPGIFRKRFGLKRRRKKGA
jgi:hypothetical protein